MRSLLVEFHRFGDLNTGLLRKGDQYLVAAAAHKVRQVEMPLNYEDFLDYVDAFRYQTGVDARKRALENVSAIVTDLLTVKTLPELNQTADTLQLDLVVNAAELGSLPFEAALDKDGQPLLVRDDRPVVLTRRVRGQFAETQAAWPAKANILFAWASPRGASPVPSAEHESALRKALATWLPSAAAAGASSLLTVLPRATLRALAAAASAQRFTHVHLLAHGAPILERKHERFGLALHDPATGAAKIASPEEIGTALEPLLQSASVITVSACDSGNDVDTFMPKRSIAHHLHEMGFPVVAASQFPLTGPGSVAFVGRFYSELLDGNDVRDALQRARCTLYNNRQTTGHDWASVVGYVRLPEGYREHLNSVRLQSRMSSLRAIRSRTDELISRNAITRADVDELASALVDAAAGLIRFLSEVGQPREAMTENLGLLGSAEKRLAELHFRCGRCVDGYEWRESARFALGKARSWYAQGFTSDFNSHWNGVQYLSLAAVLTGKLSEVSHWHASLAAAKQDASKPREIWAFGSLAELFLLAPFAGLGNMLDLARGALESMKSRAIAAGDSFPLESTELQLRRYIDWWTSANGFFPGAEDLAKPASELARIVAGPRGDAVSPTG